MIYKNTVNELFREISTLTQVWVDRMVLECPDLLLDYTSACQKSATSDTSNSILLDFENNFGIARQRNSNDLKMLAVELGSKIDSLKVHLERDKRRVELNEHQLTIHPIVEITPQELAQCEQIAASHVLGKNELGTKIHESIRISGGLTTDVYDADYISHALKLGGQLITLKGTTEDSPVKAICLYFPAENIPQSVRERFQSSLTLILVL